NLNLCEDESLTPHAVFLGLGSTPADRASAYREWLQAAISEDDLHAIRAHIRQERALGSLRFQRMVEKTLNRPVALRARGRPRRIEDARADQSPTCDVDSNG
ncbi:MAG: transposase, partial [Dokdonella sp.]